MGLVIIELTEKDRRTLMTVINSEVGKIHRLRDNLESGQNALSVDKVKSGAASLTERIHYLHDLKIRMGCASDLKNPSPYHRKRRLAKKIASL